MPECGKPWLGSRLGKYAPYLPKDSVESEFHAPFCTSTFGHNPMLICDGCDAGWHLLCLEGLHVVPDGSWFCSSCAARNYVSCPALCALALGQSKIVPLLYRDRKACPFSCVFTLACVMSTQASFLPTAVRHRLAVLNMDNIPWLMRVCVQLLPMAWSIGLIRAHLSAQGVGGLGRWYLSLAAAEQQARRSHLGTCLCGQFNWRPGVQ
jgi:hypothetical protein